MKFVKDILLFQRYGIFRELVSDNAMNFLSSSTETFLNNLGV